MGKTIDAALDESHAANKNLAILFGIALGVTAVYLLLRK